MKRYDGSAFSEKEKKKHEKEVDQNGNIPCIANSSNSIKMV